MHKGRMSPRAYSNVFLIGNAVLAIAVFLAVVFQVIKDRQDIIQKTKDRVLSTSLITEEAILASFKAIDIVTDQIVFEVSRESDSNHLSEIDRTHYLDNIGKIKSILLTWVDENGNPLGKEFDRKEKNKERINYSDRDYFKTLKVSPVGAKVITKPLVGKSTGKWVFIIAKRLSDRNGRFKGAVVVAITQAFFEEIKSKIDIKGKNSFTVTVGESPTFFYRFPDKPEIIGTTLIPNPDAATVINKTIHRAVFETRSPVDGAHRVAAHTWIGTEPIMLIIGLDIDEALAPWVRQTVVAILTSLLGLGLFIFLNYNFLKTNKKIKNYQSKLASSVKMSALGEMAGGMAHEINNPLTIIRQNTEVLLEMFDGDVDIDMVRKLATKVISTTDRIAKIIKGLRAFSRNGDDDPFSSVNILQVIEETLGICREKFKSRGVELIAVDLPSSVVVECRQVQISQVILNLLNNSFDAIEKTVEPWIKLEVKELDDWVELSITDSGQGIPQAIQEKIFQPFYTTKEVGKGTGLGLSISKGIIESHKGEFRVDNTCKNTRFVILLPKLQKTKEAIKKAG